MNRAQLLESWLSLSQILSRVFLSKNMQLVLTKYCRISVLERCIRNIIEIEGVLKFKQN